MSSYDIESREEYLLVSKAMDDGSSIEFMLYNLIKFCADSRISPDGIAQLTEAIKIIQKFRDGYRYKVERYEEKNPNPKVRR